MTILKRLVDEVQLQFDTQSLAGIDGNEDLDDFVVDLDREIDLSRLESEFRAFQNRPLTSADDSAMALALRKTLTLSPREAADRNVWWWLCVRRFPQIVQARWANDNKVVTERMFGQVNRNALARLWWGAELVQPCGQPAKYVGLLFKNQDLFEAVIGRSLARYPDALGAILEELSSLKGVRARETVRNFRFLLSTLVLEALDKESLRSELKRSIPK